MSPTPRTASSPRSVVMLPFVTCSIRSPAYPSSSARADVFASPASDRYAADNFTIRSATARRHRRTCCPYRLLR